MRTGAIICDPWWQSIELWLAVLVPLSGLLGVALGFLLGFWKDSRDRRQRSTAHWAALRAEIEFCCYRAQVFLGEDPQVAAPLYRLPTIVYLHSFPALLADGVPTGPDTRSLIQFYSEVETLNRGLDLAQAARDDEQTLLAEHGRNRLKATSLVQEYCPEALAVVNRHLQ